MDTRRLQPPECSRMSLFKDIVTAALLALMPLAGCTSVTDALNPDAIVTPRLETNEPERRAAIINAEAFNAKAQQRTLASYGGYIGDLRTSFEGNPQTIARDLNELAQTAPRQFNPNELVTINFSNASLNLILEQVLRGALGVNFVAPDNLPTVSSFKVDSPVPKSRLLQMVRDLLARHNLAMRQFNGMYHIGPPELIETMAANVARGGGTDGTRLVRLQRGNAQQVAALANQLLTSGIEVIDTNAPDSLLIRGNASDMAAAERMLQTLSATAVGYDQVAILPLARSAPEAVAQQLTAFFSSTLRREAERITVVPLQNQQAILVGTSHPALMKNIRQLVAQLDRAATDQSDLRVIPLTHLRPWQIAAQLAQVFGGDTGPLPAANEGSGLNSSSSLLSRLKVPGTPAGQTDAQPARDAEQTETSADSQFPAARSAASGSGIRIVPDDRTNSLLVYSTYSVFKRMRDVVQLLDVPQAQVVIEATVIEVDLNDSIQSGVDFLLRYSGLSFGNAPASDTSLFSAATDVGHLNVQAAIQAMRTLSNVRIVSSPYLTVLDCEPARLVIGDQVPFATTTQSTIVDGRSTTTTQTQILDTGIVLQIVPRIHANNSVSLEIQQSVSKVADKGIEGAYRPTISTRDITSRILAQSGRTVLLGGLIQEKKELGEKGIPIAASIPVVGQLFRSNSDSRQRTELLVLITPRVSRASMEIEEITRTLRGLQHYQGYPDLKR